MTDVRLIVDIARQQLTVQQAAPFPGGAVLQRYPVSTAAAGVGERRGSFQTPRGKHRVRAKIGAGEPLNTVFVARRPTGEICNPQLMLEHPVRDWILTRILWLGGAQPGYNRFGEVDTQRRYIYIHGCPDNTPLGQPGSHGCIRMRNADLLELFELTPVGSFVHIVEDASRPESVADVVVRPLDWRQGEAALQFLRQQVFVEEQGIPATMEIDGQDPDCRHFLAWDRWGAPIGCARLLPSGYLGRMAVLPAWRDQGVGQQLLAALCAEARQRGFSELLLNAAQRAVPFYRRAGAVEVGEPFVAAGIPHQRMRLPL